MIKMTNLSRKVIILHSNSTIAQGIFIPFGMTEADMV